MEFKKKTTITVTHLFRKYLCEVGWDENYESLSIISVKHKNSNKEAKPSTKSAIYLKAINNQTLRSKIISSIFPENAQLIRTATEDSLTNEAENTGFWIGCIVFFILGLAIYWAYQYLLRLLDEEWASLITLIPSFFAFVTIFLVQRQYVAYVRRKYCKKNGHILEYFISQTGDNKVMCRRCHLFVERMIANKHTQAIAKTEFLCSLCLECACTLQLFGEPLKVALMVNGFTSSREMRIPTKNFEPLLSALTRGDARAAHALDIEYAPFFCPQCDACYCGNHWQIWNVFDEDGWHDSIRGRCPKGHERMIED